MLTRHMLLAAAALLFTTGTTASGAPVNLALNGGFENGPLYGAPSDWHCAIHPDDPAGCMVADITPHAGTRHLLLFDYLSTTTVGQSFAVETGTDYTLTFFAATNFVSSAIYDWQFDFGPIVPFTFTAANTYQKVSTTFTATDTSVHLSFAATNNSTSGALLIDSVSLVEATTGMAPIPLPPAALALLGGFAALGALKRLKQV